MSALLARPQIAMLKAYASAAQLQDTTRLNANEVSWDPAEEFDITPQRWTLNRYPQVRPWQLRDRLAETYSVLPEQLLVTRGSSEAIDLLLRVFCVPSEDNIVVTPPTFGMYRVYADIQQASVKQVPLRAENDFSLDSERLLSSVDDRTKLIFLCSPNNPTGNTLSKSDIEAILVARQGRSLVVVDEAYVEFSQVPSVIQLLADHENLVVLRTLSKAHGLAAARIGSVIAHPDIVRLLDSVLAPYAIAHPIVELGLQALAVESLARTESRIQQLLLERGRIVETLFTCTAVERTWQSDANFVLVRFRDLELALEKLASQRILIRDFSKEPGLQRCARITMGSSAENDRLLDALRALEAIQ
jgi:histidinol-phosphate aminotransferase